MSDGLTVHVRVNDTATSQPTPVRIRFEAQGRSFAPFGRLDTFPTESGVDVGGQVQLGEQRFYYIDGTCEVRLPAGDVTIEATKGPEYAPLHKTVTLAPGQISLRLTIHGRTTWRGGGWYSGDTRVLCLDPFAALLEAEAEDVAVVNLLAHERSCASSPAHRNLPNLLAFSGQEPALERPGNLVVVNTLNVHPILGALGLLNCHRAVFPLRSGDEGDDWTLADWCDQCHRKHTGLVVWAVGQASSLPTSGRPEACPTGQRLRSEALADLLLGKIDAFEIVSASGLADWYQLLDAGLRVPLVGGSGKDSNAVVLGSVRTYARLVEGEPLSYAGWIEALRAGRTFVTSGPLLSLSVDSQEPSAVLRARAGQPVRLCAYAAGCPVDRLELLVNGTVVGSTTKSSSVEAKWKADRSAWVAARCQGPSNVPDGQCVFAQTSPVYVQVEGRPFQPAAGVVESLAAHLEHMAGWARTAARCPTEHHRDNLLSVFTAALDRLRGNTSPA
ncbi:MAG: CehA/McbA family metallohydrolase [Planctomycetes bacterium]|nr:CehA/McbA family metallohydrolase [Planctomycetota bacterium]